MRAPVIEYEAPPHHPDRAARVGLVCGLGAYLAWGFIPLYFRLLRGIPPIDVVSHRVAWSVVFLTVLLTVQNGWAELRAALRSRRTMLRLCGSTIVIAANWLIFIWAVEHDQVLQASLGYFINPLVSVVLAMTFLKERLRPVQIASVLLATVAVVILTVAYGRVPWVAVSLALSFGFYGLIRKTTPVGPLPGLSIETALLLPLALAYVLLISDATPQLTPRHVGLLAISGPITALPLLLFAAAAHRLRLTTLGFLQYVGPICQFLLAVLVFKERFEPAQQLAFGMIWAALVVFTVDSVKGINSRRRAHNESAMAAPAPIEV